MNRVLGRCLALNIFRVVFVKDARRNNVASLSYIKVGNIIGTLNLKSGYIHNTFPTDSLKCMNRRVMSCLSPRS